MSLSAWEQQVLDSIKDDLAGSDPRLVALLITFTRLASDEKMPVREKVHATSRRAPRSSRPKPGHPRRNEVGRHARREYQHLGLAMMLLWLLITVALIAFAVESSRGSSQDACPGPWPLACADAPAPSSSPGVP